MPVASAQLPQCPYSKYSMHNAIDQCFLPQCAYRMVLYNMHNGHNTIDTESIVRNFNRSNAEIKRVFSQRTGNILPVCGGEAKVL